MWGSSPLARGTQEQPQLLHRRTGLIPARAGNTTCTASRIPTRGAHPRSRGEHRARRSFALRSWGSSPLARGTPANKWLVVASHGLIPARAGNTLGINGANFVLGAHPRSRGEHTETPTGWDVTMGSSPLARGTLWLGSLRGLVLGLIPARAGNTGAQLGRYRALRAHPRSRGEHLSMLEMPAMLRGSSPLARGTLLAAS